MRSISAGSVVERNNSRWRSTRLFMSMHDWHMPYSRATLPLHAFRKYDSTCLAVVSARLRKLANPVNGSDEVHCLAARKTEMVRFDVFAVHQPQYADFSTEPPDVQMRTRIRSRAMRRGGSRRISPSCRSWCGAKCRCTPSSDCYMPFN